MSLELIRLGWLARELQGVPCPHLPRAGIRSTCCHPWLLFYVGSGVSNSDPQVCKASALEAHHLLSPFSVFLSDLTAQLSCEVPPSPHPILEAHPAGSSEPVLFILILCFSLGILGSLSRRGIHGGFSHCTLHPPACCAGFSQPFPDERTPSPQQWLYPLSVRGN